MKRQKHFTMRSVIILGLALIFSLQLKAKEISEAKAFDIANSFFQKNETRAIDNSLKIVKIADSNTLLKGEISTLSSTLSPTFYIFAPEKDKGFIIVSGDESTRPILGYSFDNEVSTLENLPCNFKYWLKAMDSQVTYYREMGDEKKYNSEEEDLNIGNIVTKYETALWDQLEPYWLQCPMDEEEYSLTGCVTTALCIAMKYFSHPQKGQGSTPAYYTLSKNILVDSRNLEHEYLWDDMLMEYNDGEYTQENADAIATLMADVSAVCYSDYTNLGTEVEETWILEGDFASHFFYSPNMYYEYSYSYSEDEWESLLVEELEKNSAPIPYFGYSSEDEGHMFIIDGYTENNYFSFNWGWGGIYNGYFLIPNIPFNQYQGALLNFIPDDGSILNATLGLYDKGIFSDTEVYANSVPFNVNAEYIMNISATPFTGKFRLGLTNSEGEFKQWISEEIVQDEEIAPADNITLNNVECIIQEDIAIGDCIRLYYMNNTTNEWKVMNSSGRESIWEIVLNEDNTSRINAIAQDIESASLDENIYDLSGRKVTNQKHPGVYINKGKKIIIK